MTKQEFRLVYGMVRGYFGGRHVRRITPDLAPIADLAAICLYARDNSSSGKSMLVLRHMFADDNDFKWTMEHELKCYPRPQLPLP